MPDREGTPRCTGCGLRAAIYRGEREHEFLCGHCGRKASVFAFPPTSAKVKRVQAKADRDLARAERAPDA